MEREVNKEGLKSGKVLIIMKERFLNNRTRETMLQFMDCLTDCEVWVPMNLKIEEEDANQFKNCQVGDVVELKNDMRMRPDWLKNGGKLFFPIFSNVEEATEAYSKNFSWINMDISRVISFFESKPEATGIVLDAFTMPLELDRELVGVLKSIIEIKSKQ